MIETESIPRTQPIINAINKREDTRFIRVSSCFIYQSPTSKEITPPAISRPGTRKYTTGKDELAAE